MTKHFEFVPGDEKVIAPGRTVKRIRALVAIAALGITPGTTGGYVEKPENLSGNAWVSGDARVSGNAEVESRLDHLQVGPAKSSGRFTTAHKDKKIGVRVNCGCFSGSVLEFSRQIEKTHANHPEALQQYRLFCQLIAFNFGVAP